VTYHENIGHYWQVKRAWPFGWVMVYQTYDCSGSPSTLEHEGWFPFLWLARSYARYKNKHDYYENLYEK